MAGVDGQSSSVPGQTVLPGMADDMGYDSASPRLKPWEERFCWKYNELGIATQAYLSVKPKSTYGTARAESAKLLAKPSIKARIAEVEEEIGREAKALLMGHHKRVLGVDRIAALNEVETKPQEEWSKDVRAILEFKQVATKHGVVTLMEMPPRHQSAVELARIIGIHKDKVALTGEDGGPVEVEITSRPQVSREEWLAIHGIVPQGE